MLFSFSHASQDILTLFPLENYNQTISHWINPTSTDYDQPLITPEIQQKQMDNFYNHTFGAFSPWEPGYVNQIIAKTPPNDLKSVEQFILNYYSNQNKDEHSLGYGSNFRPYSAEWTNAIAANVNLSQFNFLAFQSRYRAIAIDNLHARALPTEEVYFYSHRIAGEGYPFDNLQMSAVWAGTPLYVLGSTKDQAWSLIFTPELIGWVKTSGIAYANDSFVNTWRAAAKKNLVAITRTQTSIIDEQGQFRLSAYVGTVFPGEKSAEQLRVMIPATDIDHHAVIKYAALAADDAVLMPIPATPHHITQIMNTLIGRVYGWGGEYFYNDCSAELKSLFTPFGIWLPRHSSRQAYSGKMIDRSSATPEQRLSYLMENGRPLLTLVYIGGHIFMYLGNYPHPHKNHATTAMTYQNMWGLSPSSHDRRAVIGKAVLFPLLLEYPEDTSLASLASGKYFQVTYLDQMPSEPMKLEMIDLKAWMAFGSGGI